MAIVGKTSVAARIARMTIMMMLKTMYQFGSQGYSDGMARYPIFPDHSEALP
jgi:hypothetical protein